MDGRGKPAGRIDATTMSVGDALGKTVTADSTLAVDPVDTDFAELRNVPRDNYIIGGELARGGMGVILDARDRRTGRRLAIKEVLADVMDRDPAAVRAAVLRFRREAMLTAQLQHPSIVPVYEIGRFGQTPFIAMKRVSGTPFDEVLDDCERPEDRLALLPKLIAVADAIAYAHSRGVVHRDLKPSNVIVGDFGETIVIDWGLAKSRATDDILGPAELGVAGDLETVAGAVFGTPQYMAPEQAAGEVVGPGADVYALGAMLFELLTGEAPHSREIARRASKPSVPELIELVAGHDPRERLESADQAPADLISIANKAMARTPEERYASASEMAADLSAFERGQLVDVHSYTTLELVARWVRRHRAVVITALALFIVGAASTTWFVVQTIAARDEATLQKNRASDELLKAMGIIRDRGFDELGNGNLQRAAVSLSTAYHHLDDPSLRIALAEVMGAVDPYVRLVAHHADSLPVSAIDRINRRLAIDIGGRTRVIDLEGKLLFEVDGGAGQFSARGRRLVTSRGETLLLWSDRGEAIAALPWRHRSSWAASYDGARAITLAGDRAIVFSTETGEILMETKVNLAQPIGSIAISDDGRRALLTRIDTHIFNLDTLTVTVDERGRDVISPLGFGSAASSMGKMSAFSRTPGVIDVVISDDLSQRRRLNVHDRTIDTLRFSDDGASLISSDIDGGLCFTNIESRDAICDLEAGITSFETRGELVVSGHRNGTVSLWDVRGHRLAQRAAHVEGMTFASIVGGALITAGADGAVRAWTTDPPAGDQVFEPGDGESLRFIPPLVARTRDGKTTFTGLERGSKPVTVDAGAAIVTAVSRDGSRIVSGGKLWTGSGDRLPATELETATCVALDGTGSRLATCQPDGTIAVTTGDGRALFELDTSDLDREGIPTTRDVRFSESGKRLFVSTHGASLVFDAATGARVATLAHDALGEGALARVFSIRDDTRLVTQDGLRFILWSQTGQRLAEMQTPSLTRTARHPDGRRVVLGVRTAIGFFGERDDEAVEWLGRGRLTEETIVAIGVSEGGQIAAGTLAGGVVVYDGDGKRLISRVANDIRGVVLDGERLIVDCNDGVYVWPLAGEKRSPADVGSAVDALVGDLELRSQTPP